MKLAPIALFPLVLPFSTILSLGQVVGTDSPVCNAKFAQLMVEQQVMESKSVVEQVKRTKILIRSADFLWQFDQPIARTYFAEAFKIADDRFLETGFGDSSESKAQILLGLANMYERVNHSVALDELGEAIHVTNSLKDPDIFATSVQRQIAGDGFGFYASFHTPGYNLETAFEELSKKDFEMSLANAKALDDQYFRTLAVIAVANNCAKNSKPAAKPKVNDRP